MPVGSNIVKWYEAKKDNKEIYIIDSHSHFGQDGFWENYGDYNEYIKYCSEQEINEVYSMPVACPIINREDGTKTMLSYYEIEGNITKSYRVDDKEGKKVLTPHLLGVNPYAEANDIMYKMCKNNVSNIKFNYVPLIHPYYYSYDDIETHIKRGAQMLKIHGIACGVIPNRIDPELFKIIEHFKIPVIIHTDYSREENILSYNSAANWLERFKDYDINVYLTHAARLSDIAVGIVNSDDRYIVGLGPDKLLSIDGQNEHNPKNYLDYCFSKFDINKIVFDIDYPWNIQNTGDYTYDWGSIYRVSWELTDSEKEKVFSKNIKRFVKERRK